MTLFLELVGLGVLILLNAFFVAAEYALVTVRRTRVQELAEEGKRRARAVQWITADPFAQFWAIRSVLTRWRAMPFSAP